MTVAGPTITVSYARRLYKGMGIALIGHIRKLRSQFKCHGCARGAGDQAPASGAHEKCYRQLLKRRRELTAAPRTRGDAKDRPPATRSPADEISRAAARRHDRCVCVQDAHE